MPLRRDYYVFEDTAARAAVYLSACRQTRRAAPQEPQRRLQTKWRNLCRGIRRTPVPNEATYYAETRRPLTGCVMGILCCPFQCQVDGNVRTTPAPKVAPFYSQFPAPPPNPRPIFLDGLDVCLPMQARSPVAFCSTPHRGQKPTAGAAQNVKPTITLAWLVFGLSIRV
jgi:hypothetical protein